MSNSNNLPNKTEEEDTQLTNEEIENNFYVQATKETFGDLLLTTEKNDLDEIRHLTNEEGENKQEKIWRCNYIDPLPSRAQRVNKIWIYNRPINKEMTQEEKQIDEKEEKKIFYRKNT